MRPHLLRYTEGNKRRETTVIPSAEADRLAEYIGEELKEKLDEDIELLDGASAEFDLEVVRSGN